MASNQFLSKNNLNINLFILTGFTIFISIVVSLLNVFSKLNHKFFFFIVQVIWPFAYLIQANIEIDNEDKITEGFNKLQSSIRSFSSKYNSFLGGWLGYVINTIIFFIVLLNIILLISFLIYIRHNFLNILASIGLLLCIFHFGTFFSTANYSHNFSHQVVSSFYIIFFIFTFAIISISTTIKVKREINSI